MKRLIGTSGILLLLISTIGCSKCSSSSDRRDSADPETGTRGNKGEGMDENARVFIEIRHVGASDKPIKSLVFTNYVLVDEGMTKNAIFPRTTIRVTNQQIRDVLAVVRTHWVSKNSAKGDFGTFKFLVSIDGSLDSFLADRSRSKEILTGISRCLESLENAVTAINRVHKRLGDED